MDKNSKISRLRIYVSSTDKVDHTLLSEYLVKNAQLSGLAGATVTKGIIGFGASSVIHSYKLWEITEKVPVVVEVIDEAYKVKTYFEQLRPVFENMRYGCLVTVEDVDVLLYKAGNKRSG